MKKHKRQRLRLKPLASAQRQVAPAQTPRARLRWIGWVVGLGLLVALIGYFVSHNQPAPVQLSSTAGTQTTNAPAGVPVNTAPNAPVAQNVPHWASNELGVPPGAATRPGAVKNLESEGDADDLNNKGVQLLDGGNAARAIPILQKAVTLNPDDETFHFNLGVAYMKVSDSTNAEHEYKEALQLLPDYPEAHNNYGNVLASAGRLTEAEEQLKEAVEGTPDSASFNNNLGVLRQRLNKTNEALVCFQKAVGYDTNFAEAHFNLAQAYLARRERQKGIAELLEVLRLKPDFAPAKRALARATATP